MVIFLSGSCWGKKGGGVEAVEKEKTVMNLRNQFVSRCSGYEQKYRYKNQRHAMIADQLFQNFEIQKSNFSDE